ncbi:MAG: DUF1440 domain-containing protein [Chthoniobacterales bacterium]|nr:DUF1440 domain-containing protein [Chthoniobacterales bacterium]
MRAPSPLQPPAARCVSLSLGQAFFYGLVAGLVATGVKTVCELISPPRPPGAMSPLANMIDSTSLLVTGAALTESARSITEPVVHFGFGAVSAGVYVVLSERFPILRVGCGSLFGVLFWLGLHETFLPLAGFSPSPAQMSAWEQGNELVSHIFYGVTVELVRRCITRKLA